MLCETLRCTQKTNGTFNPVVGVLVDLWTINKREKSIPDLNKVRCAPTSCDYCDTETDGTGRYRIHNGADIDLGEIEKGYMADGTDTLYWE